MRRPFLSYVLRTAEFNVDVSAILISRASRCIKYIWYFLYRTVDRKYVETDSIALRFMTRTDGWICWGNTTETSTQYTLFGAAKFSKVSILCSVIYCIIFVKLCCGNYSRDQGPHVGQSWYKPYFNFIIFSVLPLTISVSLSSFPAFHSSVFLIFYDFLLDIQYWLFMSLKACGTFPLFLLIPSR